MGRNIDEKKAMCSLIYLLGGYSINDLLIDSMYGSNSNFIYFCGMFSGFSAELQQCNVSKPKNVLEGQAWITQEWLFIL